jgi:RNA polymerase sigma-70 factor (ECF subfamily)
LVRRHERRVYRLLLRMLGSREEAEDAAQETFLNLHRHGQYFRGDALFSTFVYRVAANAALNRRRTLGRSHAREQGLARLQQTGAELPAAPLDPERAAAAAEERATVQAALLELSPRLRLPLVLYDLEGLPYPEIARMLDLPEGTVKSRIHRARERLREILVDAGALGAREPLR